MRNVKLCQPADSFGRLYCTKQVVIHGLLVPENNDIAVRQRVYNNIPVGTAYTPQKTRVFNNTALNTQISYNLILRTHNTSAACQNLSTCHRTVSIQAKLTSVKVYCKWIYLNITLILRCGVSIVVLTKTRVLRDMALRPSVNRYRYFGGACCLHLQVPIVLNYFDPENVCSKNLLVCGSFERTVSTFWYRSRIKYFFYGTTSASGPRASHYRGFTITLG